jgi:hypothetical protein
MDLLLQILKSFLLLLPELVTLEIQALRVLKALLVRKGM